MAAKQGRYFFCFWADIVSSSTVLPFSKGIAYFYDSRARYLSIDKQPPQ
jgi:hypothetical protein